MVARPLPRRTASMAPFSRIENTMIGIRFSRASAKAVASITLQILVERLLMAELVVALGVRVLFRVGAVDAVDVGGLEHGVRVDLGGAQHGGRVGGEERIAGAAGEHHDAAFLEMPQRAPALIGLADLRHGQRRHACAPRRRRARSRLSSTSAFITVASMPMASAVGREHAFIATIFDAAQHVAAADDHAEL